MSKDRLPQQAADTQPIARVGHQTVAVSRVSLRRCNIFRLCASATCEPQELNGAANVLGFRCKPYWSARCFAMHFLDFAKATAGGTVTVATIIDTGRSGMM